MLKCTGEISIALQIILKGSSTNQSVIYEELVTLWVTFAHVYFWVLLVNFWIVKIFLPIWKWALSEATDMLRQIYFFQK